MTRAVARQLIMDRLGKRTGLDTQVNSEISLSQSLLEGGEPLPWFLRTNTSSINLSSGSQSYDLPSDFLREDEDNRMRLLLAESRPHLERNDLEFLESSVDLYGTGQPTHYAISGLKLYVFKTPDATYSTRFYYYKSDTVLVSDIENLWLKYVPDLLIAETGLRMASFLRDANMVQLFTSERNEAFSRMVQRNAAYSSFSSEVGG